MRVFSEEVYGVPPEQAIGLSIKTRYEVRDGEPVIVRLPEIDFIDDKDGKPVGIQKFIGRRPIAAFGNSDGDLQMFEWTTSGDGPRFALYVHHTDGEREWAYDRDSNVGRLDKGLDAAAANGWTVVNMKRDWITVFPAHERSTHPRQSALTRRVPARGTARPPGRCQLQGAPPWLPQISISPPIPAPARTWSLNADADAVGNTGLLTTQKFSPMWLRLLRSRLARL